MKNNVRRMLPAFALIVSLASPFAAMAQVDDVYFVPSKKSEEKVLVIKSTAEKYNISTASASQGRDVDEYNRRSTAYTDSPDEYIDENYNGDYSYEEGAYDDYSYSTRIIRFRNPRRAMYSPIYWDLMYGCGVSDWLIYDNGYSIDIYPTYNNHLYFYSDFAFGWNPFSWYSWSCWHYPGYYGWHHPYHSPYYNHFYGHYYPGHLTAGVGGGYWGPARRSTRFVPTNGAVSGGGRSARGEGARSERGTVSSSRADRGSMRADGNVRRNGSTGNGRSMAQSGNKRNESGAGFRIESNDGKTQGRDNAIRRQQPTRGSVNNGGNRGVNGNVNAGVRQESSKGASGSSSVNRRESGASSGYNRPSSTSTVRSRSSSSSSSSSVRSSSGSSSNSRSSSSYRSGSSSSRSSSSYGGSSGSSRSGSSFGGSSGSSRGSSSGGSRSGGRGR